ncbi:hypothetical protein R0K19_22840, partial [Bacillus sp. SIMBA_161]
WVLRKTDRPRMETVLYVLAEVVRQLAILAQPFMPDATSRLLDQVAQPAEARDFTALAARLEAGRTIEKPQGVFPRYVEEETEKGNA